MFLGYVFRAMFTPGFDGVRRRKILLYTGLTSLALFIILRFINIYGDPLPWSVQPRGSVFTFLSFLNISKYPPSLLYLFVTIGAGLVILSFTEKISNEFTSILIIYGNVPFFYYVLHFYLLRFINVILFFATGFTTRQIVTPNSPALFRPDTFGFSLGGVYLIWLFVIVVLYFPCRWFSKYKKTHRQWWLSYF